MATDGITNQWIYFIKHAGEMDFIPDSFSPHVNEAFSLIDESMMSAKELEAQHKRKEFIFIQKSSLALAEEKGLEQGREEGANYKSVVIARNMLGAGMSVEQVAQLTELSVDQVRALKV